VDSVRDTYGVSAEVYAWKMELGRGRTRPDFSSRRELLPLVVPSWPARVVLLGLYPCKVDY
jgi:hypothetical protein